MVGVLSWGGKLGRHLLAWGVQVVLVAKGISVGTILQDVLRRLQKSKQDIWRGL